MMSDLYRLTVEPQNPGRTDAEVSAWELIADGVLVKVEPDTVITTNGNAPVFLGLDAGTYLVFEVDDE